MSYTRYEVRVYPNGGNLWYLNGKLHREDGPAIEYPSGTKGWYRNNQLHKEGSPAIEYPNGGKFWYLNDQLHREDGPAMEFSDGTKRWYLNDKKYTELEHKEELAKRKNPCANKIVEMDGVEYKLTRIED